MIRSYQLSGVSMKMAQEKSKDMVREDLIY